MKEILELIITNLVNNKDEVSIEQSETEKSIVFKVRVAKDDMGKIIGRQSNI